MKKILYIISVILQLLNLANIHAFTIDSSKSYYLIQTTATSGRVIGVNSYNKPAIMDVDKTECQQLTFEMETAGNYRIKNGDDNYLAWSTGSETTWKTTPDLTSLWVISDIGTTGFVSLMSASSGNAYLTTSESSVGIPLKVNGTVAPTMAGNNAFKLALVSDLLKNNMIDGGFEYAVINGKPIGVWINDASLTLGDECSSRVIKDVASSGKNSFQLRFLGTQDACLHSYNKISHLITGLKKNVFYTLSFSYIQYNWILNTGTFTAYASTTANTPYGYSSTNIEGTSFTSKPAAADNVKNSGSITFLAPSTSCYIVFSKVSPTINSENYLDDLILTTSLSLPASIATSASAINIENTVPATFTVSGYGLSEDISITSPSDFTVSVNKIDSKGRSIPVVVNFTGSKATTNTITLTSGSVIRTIDITGTPTISPSTKTEYYFTQKSSYNTIGSSLSSEAILSKPNKFPTQKIRFESTERLNTFYIKNDSDLYLSYDGTNKISFETSANSDLSKWVVVGTTLNEIKLKTSTTGKYLTSAVTETDSTKIILGTFEDKNCMFMLNEKLALRKLPCISPRWSFEHIVWEDMKNTQTEIENLVDLYLQNKMPVGSIIIDSPWSTAYNNFEWNRTRYPNSTEMIRKFKSKNINVILWLTGCVNNTSTDVPIQKDETFDEVITHNYAINDGKVSNWWKGNGVHIDFTNPKAVEWWNNRLDKVFVDGVSGFKVDMGESYFGGIVKTSIGNMTNSEFAPYYYNSIADYVTNRKADGIILARPFSYQTGHFHASVDKLGMGWCGDFMGSFIGLRKQINNIYISAEGGYGAIACEIGGYYGDLAGKEELIRYAQFASMTACMENGGANGGLTNHLPWFHDEETTACYRQAAWLHSQLIPYLFSTVVKTHKYGGSLIRNLSYDKLSHTVGEDIFTQAIISNDRNANITLPSGGKWMDFWTKAVYSGNSNITQHYSLNKFPLFIKVGSIIPMNISNSYSGIGDSTLAGKQSVYFVHREDEGESKYQYFRPIGDGIEYDSIMFTNKTKKQSIDIAVEGKTNLPYALLVQNCPKIIEVLNADDWKYNEQKQELVILKTGASFVINIQLDTVTNLPTLNYDSIKMYPNPATDKILIESPVSISFLSITDIKGSKIYEINLNKTKATINTNMLNRGVYLVKITTATRHNIVKKLVVW